MSTLGDGGTVLVRLLDPTHTLPDGETVADPAMLAWSPVQHRDPANCEHVETICPTCLPQWQTDHDVTLALPDPDAPPPERP